MAAKETRGAMSALTTIANPLSAIGDKVMIFSSSKNYTLSLENRTIGGTFVGIMGTTDATSAGPQLAYPSQLTSIMYKDAVCYSLLIVQTGSLTWKFAD
jgi:hypothetical protein